MRKKRKRRILCGGLILLAVLILILLFFSYSMGKNIQMEADSVLNEAGVFIINHAVKEVLSSAKDSFNMLVVEKDEEGKARVIKPNSALMNEIALSSSLKIQEELKKQGEITLKVPWGNLLATNIFTGVGPNFEIVAVPKGSVETNYDITFHSEGVNQTRYSVFLKVEITFEMMVGIEVYESKVLSEVSVCETIIVGDVPETYALLPSETDFLNLLP